MDEKDLIIATKQGNHSAFEELYNRYWFQVYHFALLYIRERGVVREVVQDVFVKLWESRALLREDENFKGYLFIITRNHIFNRSRRAHFNDEFYRQTIDKALEHSYRIESEIESDDMEGVIDRLIEEMPRQRRTVFMLSRKQHKSHKEIADELGISEKTVERHIGEAVKYIKSNLELYAIFILISLI